LNDSFEFKVGPPDDAENLTVMKIGLQARRNALAGFKKVQSTILETNPECSAQEGVGYTWQGMLSQAAYTIVLTHMMLVKAGWKFEGKEPDLEKLFSQVQRVTTEFAKNLPQGDK